MLDGLSYWEVNKKKAKELAQNLLLGKTTGELWDSSVVDSLDSDTKAHLDSPTTETDIDMPEILGVTVPREGASPVKTIQTEQYSGTITWSPDDNIFIIGQKYKATITLVPKSGYTLKGIGANFFTVPGATATNVAGSGVITVQFPATQTAPTETTPTEKAATINISEIAG
jgi:hypothetical protein